MDSSELNCKTSFIHFASRWVFSTVFITNWFMQWWALLDAATRAGSDDREVSTACEHRLLLNWSRESQSFHVRSKTDMATKSFSWRGLNGHVWWVPTQWCAANVQAARNYISAANVSDPLQCNWQSVQSSSKLHLPPWRTTAMDDVNPSAVLG